MFWKFLLGAGVGGRTGQMTLSAGPDVKTAVLPRYPTENDILELFNLLKEVQRGFVPNQPFKGNASMTDAEKKRQKAKLSAFEGAEKELKTEQGIISNDFSRKYAEIIENPPTNKAELDAYVNELQEIVKNFMNEYSKAKFKEQGDYRPQEQQELRRIAKSHNKLIEALTKEYRFGRGKAHGGRAKTDTNFGQLMTEAEAKNPRKKNCHYNTRGFLISCSGKAHGGQAGFSLDKTREIVDQWPGFPYHVPPASKTGPMLNNPRSRVNNRTEANGRPKRICKMDMSAASIACRKGEDPPKRRGRPKKASPKEKSPKEKSPKEGGRCIKRMGKTYCGLGKKKAKKSGKPKYDVI
jgi:hypothetical protein